jgi:hypothetical protein
MKIKAPLFVLLAIVATSFAADSSNSTAPCDVPVTSSSSSTGAEQSNARSPEQPPDKVRVIHNGRTICVSSSAAAAHQRHGDKTGGACQPGDPSS